VFVLIPRQNAKSPLAKLHKLILHQNSKTNSIRPVLTDDLGNPQFFKVHIRGPTYLWHVSYELSFGLVSSKRFSYRLFFQF